MTGFYFSSTAYNYLITCLLYRLCCTQHCKDTNLRAIRNVK